MSFSQPETNRVVNCYYSCNQGYCQFLLVPRRVGGTNDNSASSIVVCSASDGGNRATASRNCTTMRQDCAPGVRNYTTVTWNYATGRQNCAAVRRNSATRRQIDGTPPNLRLQTVFMVEGRRRIASAPSLVRPEKICLSSRPGQKRPSSRTKTLVTELGYATGTEEMRCKLRMPMIFVN